MNPATRTHRAPPSAVALTEIDDPIMAKAAGLAEELAACWRRGGACRAEELLAAHPVVARHSRAAVRIIYEEVCQRQERGQPVPLQELQERFPQWHDELAIVDRCHRLFELAPSGPRFPEAGETLGDFRLLAELGRGGMGRVYLAEQAFLAGRRMILKVTPRANEEHLNLARLQHTHIVPLYSVRDIPERNVRKLCMPCLGGATLQQLLRTLRSVPRQHRSGRDLVAALETSVADRRLYWHAPGPNRRFLEQASYVQAVSWIGVCLAEALHYAHEQGLVHLDVKPSNVLLTADLQPMLLDFHLARRPIPAQATDVGWLGGTPGYMAPEQLAAWLAISKGMPLPQPVDARTDVYTLALLLREMLYGDELAAAGDTTVTAPDATAFAAARRTVLTLPARADISPGLRDLLSRCLHPDPAARYESAALVAEDLRRHLTHRPLLGVRNRSLVERWHKWRRRRPHALLVALLAVVCIGSALALAASYTVHAAQQHRVAEAALFQGRLEIDQRRFAAALATLDHALEQPGPLHAELQQARARAARGRAMAALHRQVERTRYLHGDELLAPATLRTVEAQCRAAWEQCDYLLDASNEPQAADLEEDLRHDLLDVAVLWADCRQRLAAPADAVEARRGALSLLAEAETLIGPSAVLERQRAALGGSRAEQAPAPRTAWEHYAVGRWLLNAGDLAAAARAFDRAVELRPQDFWPWFGKGLCAHRQQRFATAVTAFSVCVALAPDNAACYHNRAIALAGHGEPAAALRDYDRALELDPNLAAAALNRAVLHLQQQRLDDAEADLQRARTLGADPAAVQHNAMLIQQARQAPAR
jgi:eukaryotic-like serine/threonine-protein kinase